MAKDHQVVKLHHSQFQEGQLRTSFYGRGELCVSLSWLLQCSAVCTKLFVLYTWLPWVHKCRSSVMPRRHCFSQVLPNLWLLQSFSPSSLMVSERWREGTWKRYPIYDYKLPVFIWPYMCDLCEQCGNVERATYKRCGHLPSNMVVFVKIDVSSEPNRKTHSRSKCELQPGGLFLIIRTNPGFKKSALVTFLLPW